MASSAVIPPLYYPGGTGRDNKGQGAERGWCHSLGFKKEGPFSLATLQLGDGGLQAARGRGWREHATGENAPGAYVPIHQTFQTKKEFW